MCSMAAGRATGGEIFDTKVKNFCTFKGFKIKEYYVKKIFLIIFSIIKISVRPRIETQPEDTDVILGQSVLLNCSARGLPEPLITWTKNDEPLDFDNARFQLLENGSLMIRDAMMNDTGDYKCSATNELGSLQTDDAMLMVNSEYI